MSQSRRSLSNSPGRYLYLWLHDHLLPHKRNGHTPRALHHGSLFSYSVLLLVLKVFTLAVSVALPAASLQSAAITANNIVALTNQTRRELQLTELAVDSKLAAAAQAKADDMLAVGYFSHVSPAGQTPWFWFERYGYKYRSAGENLAANFMAAEDVTAGWMASPTHRENIVSNRFNEIGVGVAQGVFEGYPTTFVVQMFGYELDSEVQDEQVVVDQYPELVQDDPAVLTIDEKKTLITPAENAYTVTVWLNEATEALISLGQYTVPLIKEDDGAWGGSIPYDPSLLDPEGEPLTLVANSSSGVHLVRNLAWVMPSAGSSDVYAFGDTDLGLPKLLGVVDIAKIDDGVTRFYIYTMLALGGLLGLTLLLKLRQQNIRIAAHTLAVIALAFMLSLV